MVVRAEKEAEDVGAGLKAVWYGAEAVGKVVGATKDKPSGSAASSAAVAEAMAKNGGTLERE